MKARLALLLLLSGASALGAAAPPASPGNPGNTANDPGPSGMTPVRQLPLPIRIPRKEVLTALGQLYVYTLTLQLAPGEQRVAIAVRDDVAATTSYLSRAVTVSAPQAAAARNAQ